MCIRDSSPCAEHGIKGGLANHQRTQAKAVECGYFDLYRYDPRKETPLTIDSKEPDYEKMLDFMMTETRYSQLPKVKGETAYEMFEKTKKDAMKPVSYTHLGCLQPLDARAFGFGSRGLCHQRNDDDGCCQLHHQRGE